MSAATLAARGVRKSFAGVEVLHGVDLDAAGGSILALLGENGAGKSTLVKILSGEYTPDEARLEIGGQTFTGMNPRSAQAAGIRMISQEFQDAPPLSVAENISLGRLPSRFGLVSRRLMRQRAKRVLDDMSVELDLDAPVASLRIGERQVVEIARALSGEAKVLILDEPTAALSHQEVEALFRSLRRLRERGVAIIYITHRLDEVAELSDQVEVLRDGDVAAVGETSTFDRTALVSAMIGRTAAAVGRPAARDWELGAEPAIIFSNATLGGIFTDVSFNVFPGEILSVYGQLGSGSSELLECAFGLRKLTGGELIVRETKMVQQGPTRAIKAGAGFVPPDRKREAILGVRPVAENISVPSWHRLAIGGQLIRRSAEGKAYARWHDELQIRSRNDPMQPIITLSGGNQQKVVLGRWLECGTPVLLLVEPTRGVDVGARAELYRSMRDLARSGMAMLVSTSDYEEVVQVSDRALVLARGKIVAELEGDAITTENLLRAVGS